MRVQSAPSLPALAAGNEEGKLAASEGLEIFVCTRKIRGMEHMPDWTTAAGFCHYMLVARERGGQRRVRQWCFSPLDEQADTVWPWEHRGPSPLLLLAPPGSPPPGSSPPPTALASSSSSSSLGSSPTAASSYYRRSASLASLTSVASFSSFGGSGSGFGGEDALSSSSVAGDSDSACSSSSSSLSPLSARVRRVRKQRRHRNPVPGAVREEDLDAVPDSATLVGLSSEGLSLEAVGALAAAVAGVPQTQFDAAAAAAAAAAGRGAGGEGEGGGAAGSGSALPSHHHHPLYELCVNDCRHFVDDLAASVCGNRRVRAVREASRARFRQMREAREKALLRRGGEEGEGDADDEGGVLKGSEEVAAVAVSATSAVPLFPAASLGQQQQPPSALSSSSLSSSFSPLREQKEQQEEAERRLAQQQKELEEELLRQRQQKTPKQRQQQRRRRPSLHRGAGDAAVRAAQLLTDVDHWPAVAAAGKALALGALSAAAARPAAALLPCAALSLVLPADVKPAAGAAAAAVLRAPFDLAGATLRTGRAAAGAALRAATARLRRRGEQQKKKGFESDGGGSGCGGRNHAIPGLR